MAAVGQSVSQGVIVVVERLEARVDLPQLPLPLTAQERTVMRGRRRTSCGRDVLLQLPRHGVLHPGDQLVDALRSCLVVVEAAPEALLRVQGFSTLSLLQAAYHLGNRHVALELHEQELFLLDDSVLAGMLETRGLQVSRCQRPFAPEGGAYARHSHP
ncbi:urease accessory protein UreE [Synechococcus sp. MIT S1220]|uniref:urease accessory protein UreE n=1 Tax=Synechococcus sp. MIT S1220 TaxID=3082549 RepID=UPI0039B02D8B